ncbi:MAG TPA: hypothetical protein VK866_01855 [Acidimicrobiales bacterium]|nr:hypothetical protein [Acidimicrobiales bacterium]
MTDPSATHEGDREADAPAREGVEEQDPDAPAAGVDGRDESPPEPGEPG